MGLINHYITKKKLECNKRKKKLSKAIFLHLVDETVRKKERNCLSNGDTIFHSIFFKKNFLFSVIRFLKLFDL